MAKNLSRRAEVLPTLGYEFAAYDGGLRPFSYWPEQPVPGAQCPDYAPIDYEAVSNKVDVRGTADVNYADGRIIVSGRFRDFCVINGYDDLEFRRVDNRRPLFELRPTRIVDVDVERSEPLLRGFCLRCGNFDCYLVGRALILRDVTVPLEDGFYRTDLIFGCRAAKHPIIVIGNDTMRKIKTQRFSRLYFTPIPMIDPEFETRRRRSRDAEISERRRLRAGKAWRRKNTS